MFDVEGELRVVQEACQAKKKAITHRKNYVRGLLSAFWAGNAPGSCISSPPTAAQDEQESLSSEGEHGGSCEALGGSQSSEFLSHRTSYGVLDPNVLNRFREAPPRPINIVSNDF